MAKLLNLPCGQQAIVDDADFGAVSGYAWHSARSKAKHRVNFYVCRSGKAGEPSTVYLHRQIVGACAGEEWDHADRNGLNNQRSNLRRCSRSQNSANARRPNKSGYRGVYWDSQKHRWAVQIQVRGKVTCLGRFTDLVEAAKAYDRAAIEAFGEFASLNFAGHV